MAVMTPLAVGFLVAAAVWPTGTGQEINPSASGRRPAGLHRDGDSTGRPGGGPGGGAAEQPAAEGGCRPLSVRDRVAQIIMTGIPGTVLDGETEELVSRRAGSVLLQAHNLSTVAQVVALTGALRRAGDVPVLIAVDEEGGRVSRFAAAGLVTALPSPREMAAHRTVQDVRSLAAALGEELRDLGVDWNLAPVLDITADPADTVIGDRSFADDPEAAAAYGRAFVQGMAAAGILTTGKHFPGEGVTSVDPHVTLPVTQVGGGDIRRHLEPFLRAVPDLDAVMAAHVVYLALDPTLPATLSAATARLLRRAAGFSGVLMTDALEMAAITQHWSIPEAAELALGAGFDLMLVGDWRWTIPTAQRLASAVRNGRVDPSRLDEAAARVLRLKGYSPTEIECLLR